MGLLTSPRCSQYIIVSSFLKAPPLTLFDYKYPDWSITVGYIIGFSSFMWIPIYMVYKLVWTPGSLKQVSRRKERRRIEKHHTSFDTFFCNSSSLFPAEVGGVSQAREDHTGHPRRQPQHGRRAVGRNNLAAT